MGIVLLCLLCNRWEKEVETCCWLCWVVETGVFQNENCEIVEQEQATICSLLFCCAGVLVCCVFFFFWRRCTLEAFFPPFLNGPFAGRRGKRNSGLVLWGGMKLFFGGDCDVLVKSTFFCCAGYCFVVFVVFGGRCTFWGVVPLLTPLQ